MCMCDPAPAITAFNAKFNIQHSTSTFADRIIFSFSHSISRVVPVSTLRSDIYHGPIYDSPALEFIFLDCACSLSINTSNSFCGRSICKARFLSGFFRQASTYQYVLYVSNYQSNMLTAYPGDSVNCKLLTSFDDSGNSRIANSGMNVDKQTESEHFEHFQHFGERYLDPGRMVSCLDFIVSHP